MASSLSTSSSSTSLLRSPSSEVIIHIDRRRESLLTLPEDGFIEIFNYLNSKDIQAVARSCREGRRIALLDFIWEPLISYRFLQVQSEGSEWRKIYEEESARSLSLLNFIPDDYRPACHEQFNIRRGSTHIACSGNYAAFALPNGEVRLLRASGPSSLMTVHQGLATLLQFRNNRWLVTAAPKTDRSVYIIDLQNPRGAVRHMIHLADLHFSLIATNNNLIVSSDRKIHIFSLERLTTVATSAVEEDDRRIVALAQRLDRVIVAREGGKIDVFDQNTTLIQDTINTDIRLIIQMEIMNDNLFVIDKSSHLRIYDLRTMTLTYDFIDPEEEPIWRIALVGDQMVTLTGSVTRGELILRRWKDPIRERRLMSQAWIQLNPGLDREPLSMTIAADTVILQGTSNYAIAQFLDCRMPLTSHPLVHWKKGQISIDSTNSYQTACVSYLKPSHLEGAATVLLDGELLADIGYVADVKLINTELTSSTACSRSRYAVVALIITAVVVTIMFAR